MSIFHFSRVAHMVVAKGDWATTLLEPLGASAEDSINITVQYPKVIGARVEYESNRAGITHDCKTHVTG